MADDDISFQALEKLIGSQPEQIEERATVPASVAASSIFRTELQRQYQILGELSDPGKKRAAEVTFLGTVGYAISKLGLPESAFHKLIGSGNCFTGVVTDKLIEWLAENELLVLSRKRGGRK